MSALLQPFKALIHGRCGLGFEGLGEETLSQALARRLAATGAADLPSYYIRLIGNEDEFDALVSLLTINETYFFREPEHFVLLTEHLIPRLRRTSDARGRLRVLSAGCSTGEEPYSIAMALIEALGLDDAQERVSIVAGDIDRAALERATAGVYGAFSFRGVETARRERFFTPLRHGGGRLDPRILPMVRFLPLNLLGPILPDEEPFDIVFCRNVFIYFDAPTRRQILAGLRSSMNSPGYLLVGASETLANDFGVFHLTEEADLFYFSTEAPAARPFLPRTSEPRTSEPRTGEVASAGPSLRASLPLTSTSESPAPLAPSAPLPSSPSPLSPSPFSSPGLLRPTSPISAPPLSAVSKTWSAPPLRVHDEARRLIRGKRPGEARQALAAWLTETPADDEARVLDAFALLHLRDPSAAAEQALRVLDHEPWSVEACLIMGFVAREEGDKAAAVRWFKQAVYARHDCWVAQYYLGEAHRAVGAVDPARRAYKVALLHLETTPDPDGGLALPLGLPVREVRFLCERHAEPGGASSMPPRVGKA